MTDETHDPSLESWLESANDRVTEFPIQNLPYCTFRSEVHSGGPVCAGVGIGDQVLNLTDAFQIRGTQAILSMPRAGRAELRRRVSQFLANYTPGAERFLEAAASVELVLPCAIPDYSDFYASIHHATNVGRLFRPENPLMPNYKWLPVAYHGRASSIVVSGTPVRRPWGQIARSPEGPPRFEPSRRLDYEAEIGAFLGPGNALGEPIPVAAAEEHIAGVCLLNDWSARDLQSWEYQPLGPFLAKSFATSISPWIVTMEALEPFRCPAPERPEGDPRPLPHLRTEGDHAFSIVIEVWLRGAGMREPALVSRGNFQDMYWTLAQMVAHHASNGCPLRAGDLIGSGTVSGPEKGNCGCLLEMTSRGKEPLDLGEGQVRTFLEDGDEVILRGWCEAPGFRRIGLGECRGTVLPASRETDEHMIG